MFAPRRNMAAPRKPSDLLRRQGARLFFGRLVFNSALTSAIACHHHKEFWFYRQVMR